MLIKRVSRYSGVKREMEIDVTREQVYRWQAGELIQNVMPELTPDEREFIISGMTPEEWAEIDAEQDSDINS